MTINFITDVKSQHSTIGVIGWEEKSDIPYTGIRKVSGLMLLAVKLHNPNVERPEQDVRSEVESFLSTEQAEKMLECWNVDYSGEFQTIHVSKDTWFVWLKLSAQRELDETPGEHEWQSSRGVENARLF